MCYFPPSDSRHHSEEQPSLLRLREGPGAVAQREGEVFRRSSAPSEFKGVPPRPPVSPRCCRLSRMQSFGIFEGRDKEDLKNAANASGQSCWDFTPPGGETPSEVSSDEIRTRLRDIVVQQRRSVDTLYTTVWRGCSKNVVL